MLRESGPAGNFYLSIASPTFYRSASRNAEQCNEPKYKSANNGLKKISEYLLRKKILTK